MTPDPLPVDMEERLTRLLTLWANDKRLSAARASEIRDALQERDAWEQRFWMRMSTVLIQATAVVQQVPSQPWSLALPIQADLARMASQKSFDDPGSRPYLRVSV